MTSRRILIPLFFLSGFPALLYQVVWQRSLFALFGTNVESVTVVVAAFMLGLGLGSLTGGRVSRRWPQHLLRAFALMELAIGVMGLVSIPVIHAVGAYTAGSDLLTTSMVAMALVVLPTTLMGATLPVLTAYLVQRLPNVGRSVGMLYFVNTLGSASACFAAGAVLMGWLGQQGVVWLAVGFNLLVGSLAFWWSTRTGASQAAATPGQAGTDAPPAPGANSLLLPVRWAAMLAGLVGFVSLSLEIIWVRAFSFASSGRAPVFSYVIGCFLLGIALGAWGAERIAHRHGAAGADRRRSMAQWMWGLTVFATLIGFCLVPAMTWLSGFARYEYAFALVAVGAASWGAMLPLLAHVTVPADGNSGHGLSLLYAANIAGSVAGSLLTGFVLMEYLGTMQLALTVLLTGLACAWLCFMAGGRGPAGPMRAWLPPTAVVATFGVAGFFVAPVLYDHVHERLLYGHDYPSSAPFAVEIESRSGVVSITADGWVYGSGAYDGKVSTSLVNDINGVHRAFAISAYHPKPRRVLMIGLATGAWAQIVADHPDVESLQVVEINPGYLRAIAAYPDVASVLTHPKIRIDIDDGRRWMLAHRHAAGGTPVEKFDLIVMNTTWNWRAYASSILSADFLRLAQGFLADGGLIYYNATYSPEVHRTAAAVFSHSIRYSNMVLAGDRPIVADVARWESVLGRYQVQGKPVLDLTQPAARDALEAGRARFSAVDIDGAEEWDTIESRDHVLRRTAGVRIITDDNMGTEWMPNR